MRFNKMSSVRLTEAQQGELFYALKNYQHQQPEVKKKMRRICDEEAGAYASALWELLTKQKSVTQVSMEFHVSTRVLYRLRKKYFEKYWKRERL